MSLPNTRLVFGLRFVWGLRVDIFVRVVYYKKCIDYFNVSIKIVSERIGKISTLDGTD